MANLFFRTSVAPYRIDTYNTLYKKLGCEFYFLYKEDSSQKFDMQSLYNQCVFKPKFLKSLSIFSRKQKFCVNIWSILRREKPEIVIVPEFKILTVQVLLYRWLFRKNFKVVSMCDDSWDMIAHDHDFSRAHKKMRELVTPYLDSLLLVDDRVVDWYRDKYDKGIWLPIIRDEQREISGYKRILPLSIELRKKFGLVNKKVLLFVGRLAPEKNLERLLDAIAKTEEEFVTIVVGNGESEKLLKQKASNMDKPIVFTGRYEGDGVRAWYNIADVFILPSYMEPFGAVTNEALISGCECLISENAGSACLIDETNGKTFNPYDIDMMAKIIDETMKKVHYRNEITVRPCKVKILFEETMNRVIEELKGSISLKQKKYKKVLTVGVYDLLHKGHVELYRRAKDLGGYLIVAVQDSDFILKYKPTANVLNSTEDRKYMIKSIRYVNEVVTYTDVDKIVQEIDFDVFVTGPDQCHAGFLRAIKWCKEHGREHIVLGRTIGVSSSELKAKIALKTINQ